MNRRLSLVLLLAPLLFPQGVAVAQANAADSAWARGDRASAERLYERRLEADGTDATALFRLALLAGWQGRQAESIALLDRLLGLWPADSDARLARARMLRALGRNENADAAVDTVLRLEPGSIGALQLRARFAGHDGDLIESERLWRSVLAIDPGNTETRIGLSQVLRWQGRPAAAEELLLPVRLRAGSDAELADELDRVAEFMEPRARSLAIIEEDGDGNAITTLVLQSASHLGRRVELIADAYLRRARGDPAPATVTTRRGAITVALQIEPGWDLRASGGVATSDRTDLEGTATWALALGSPRRHRWATTISASRQFADYTAAMGINGVRSDLVEWTLRGRPARRWTVDVGASAGRFLGQRSGRGNGRLGGHVAVARSLSDLVSLGARASGFGFEQDTDDGYFDPSLYGAAVIEAQLQRESRHWRAVATLAPGLQQIGTDGAPGGALHAKAAFELIARPGRSVGINAVWANTGQQLSVRPAGSYRYASVGLDIRWRFR